jgi:hypothetical protein
MGSKEHMADTCVNKDGIQDSNVVANQNNFMFEDLFASLGAAPGEEASF